MTEGKLYTPTEVAAALGVAVKRVNKVIDEILPKQAVRHRRGHRYVTIAGVLAVALDATLAGALTVTDRRRAFRSLASQPGREELELSEVLFLRIGKLERFVKKQLSALEAARNMVAEEGGELFFRGTRIPLYPIARRLAAGQPEAELLRTFPDLNSKMLELAPFYARAYPRRGRPPKLASLGEGRARSSSGEGKSLRALALGRRRG